MNPTSPALASDYALFHVDYPDNPVALPAAVEIARRRLLKPDGDRQSVRLIFRVTRVPSALWSKTQEAVGGVFHWATGTSMAVGCTSVLLRFSRLVMTLGGPNDASRRKIARFVDELSGQPQLAKIIHASAPIVAKFLQNHFIKLNLYEGINAFLKEEHTSLTKIIDFLLLKMYSNIAKSIRASSKDAGNHENAQVSLVEVISCLIEIVSAHLPHIQECVKWIEKIENPDHREEQMRQLFVPLVKDFLLVAFPDGEIELPITNIGYISRAFWGQIQKKVLPFIFLDLYRQLSAPLKSDKKNVLAAQPGGETFVSLAELLGEKTREVIPTLCVSDNPAIFSSSFMGMVIEIFVSSLNASAQLKHWLKDWMRMELANLGKSTDANINKLWVLFGRYVEPVLIHIFTNMTKVPTPADGFTGQVPDAMGIIILRILTVCGLFFNKHHELIDKHIADLNSPQKDLSSDHTLLKLFAPLTEDLLSMMGLKSRDDWPLPEFLCDAADLHLKDHLPAILLKQYVAMTSSHVDDRQMRDKLRSIVFDPKNFKNPEINSKVITTLHEQQKLCSPISFAECYHKTLWAASGTEDVAKIVEGLCSGLAKDLLQVAMSHFGIASQTILQKESNLFMQLASGYLKEWLESTVVEVVVHLLESGEQNIQSLSANPSKLMLPLNVLQMLVDKIDKGFAHVDEKLKSHALSDKLPPHQLRNIFAPLADELNALGGINPLRRLPLDGLPSSKKIKEVLWTTVRMTLLPDLLAGMYAQTMVWTKQMPAFHEELESYYHTTHVAWGAKVLSIYATDFIKHYLRTSGDSLAQILVNGCNDYLARSNDPQSFTALKLLQERSGAIASMISLNLKQLGKSHDPQICSLWPALSTYLEAILARLFSGISKQIHGVQRKNPDFLIDMAIAMLQDMADYFEVINKVTEEAGEGHAFSVPVDILLSAFGKNLHDGVPLDPTASEEEKQKVRLEGHFIPLSKKLVELAGINSQDFPIPTLFKEQLMQLLLGKVLPMVLLQANAKLLDPKTRDGMMLTFVQTLHEALENIESKNNSKFKKEHLLKEEMHPTKNPKQKCLNETCGSLVLQLVKLIPTTMIQYVFMKEKVQNMSAETIGESLMPYLSRSTLLKIIDDIVFNGLPSFHASKWTGKVGREELKPLRQIEGPDGSLGLQPASRFKFIFPETAFAINESNEREREQARSVNERLRGIFTRTISSQLRVKVWDYIQWFWDVLQSHLNDFVERHFPDKGKDVKAFLDKAFHKIFFDFIGALLMLVIKPIIDKMQKVVEKTYIDKKADTIIKNLHLQTIEHLVYRWSDRFFNALRV